MTAATEISIKAIERRIKDILEADITVFDSENGRLREIRLGEYPKGSLPYPCANITLKRMNDTFYDTGDLTSNYEIYILVTVYAKGKNRTIVEEQLTDFVYWIKLAIKNNTKLYRPGTSVDRLVDRTWPIQTEPGYGLDQAGNAIGAMWITLRVTKSQ